MERIIFIPSEFRIKPFYDHSSEKIELSDENRLIVPFYHEIDCVNNQRKSDKLLQKADTLIIQLFDHWKANKKTISDLFRNRDKEKAKDPMISAIANMISILMWMNEEVLINLENLQAILSNLPIQPINFAERVSFLLKQPNNYHSFIQLAGLYEEIEKQYYKQKIKR